MNTITLKTISIGMLSFAIAGCSTLFPDKSDDYQDEKHLGSVIEMPAGSIQPKDILAVPNEANIAALTPSKPFVIPRAPSVFYPMVKVDINESSDAIEFVVPASSKKAQKVITDFLTALHGDGDAISSQNNTQIVSVPFDFVQQGWWASLWSKITRLYPVKTTFSFTFTDSENSTLVKMQFRDEQQDTSPSNWMSPSQNEIAYSVAVRLWGTLGRQLNQSSAFLSNQGKNVGYPIWVDHRGLFAVNLGKSLTKKTIETKLNSAGIYLMSNAKNVLAPVPEEDVARIGDVIDFNIPVGNGEKKKLFNVYRRNLNDVSWEEREYAYKITTQKAGDFLVIDVSNTEHPEITSFQLMQRFID